MQLPFPVKSSGLPVIKKSEFDDLGMQILNVHMPEVLKKPMAVDIRYLAEECIIVDIREEKLYPNNLLGFVAFASLQYPMLDSVALTLNEGTIVLDIRLRECKSRWRFTAAHELAHWILHRAYFRHDNFPYQFRKIGYSYIACRTDRSELGRKNPREAKTDDEWAEWQADNLAAALLMPKVTFLQAANECFTKYGYTVPRLISGTDIERGKLVVKELADLFQVSMRAVRIRMRYYDMYIGDM